MQRLHGTNCWRFLETRLLIHGMAPIRSLPIAAIPGETYSVLIKNWGIFVQGWLRKLISPIQNVCNKICIVFLPI